MTAKKTFSVAILLALFCVSPLPASGEGLGVGLTSSLPLPPSPSPLAARGRNSSANLFAQEPARGPSKPNRIVFDGDMAALLAQLAELQKVNIGLETDPTQPRPWVKVDFRFATTDDLLEGIIKAAPAYRWRNQGGFIDVYPAEGGCPLLETVIGEFHVDNTDWFAATESLMSLPEVARETSTLGLNRRESNNQRSKAVLFSLNLNNVSLRQALHEITKTSQSNFWMFKRFGDRRQEFSISNTSS